MVCDKLKLCISKQIKNGISYLKSNIVFNSIFGKVK